LGSRLSKRGDGFCLDGHTRGPRRDADGTARIAARISEYLDHEVGRPIGKVEIEEVMSGVSGQNKETAMLLNRPWRDQSIFLSPPISQTDPCNPTDPVRRPV